MTAEERKRYEAWKAEDEKKRAAEERKRQRGEYANMVDDEIRTAIPQLREMSEALKTVKDTIFGNFDAVLKMKSEILGLTRDDQRSHTFTTSDSTLRLTLGVNCIDGYPRHGRGRHSDGENTSRASPKMTTLGPLSTPCFGC